MAPKRNSRSTAAKSAPTKKQKQGVFGKPTDDDNAKDSDVSPTAVKQEPQVKQEIPPRADLTRMLSKFHYMKKGGNSSASDEYGCLN